MVSLGATTAGVFQVCIGFATGVFSFNSLSFLYKISDLKSRNNTN
jgi:hypothetical protein